MNTALKYFVLSRQNNFNFATQTCKFKNYSNFLTFPKTLFLQKQNRKQLITKLSNKFKPKHAFLHKNFMLYNKNFNQQLTMLIGQISSNYSNDLKPVKHWKIISAIRSTIEGSNAALFTRPLKSKNRRWKFTRRKLRLYLNSFFWKIKEILYVLIKK